MLIKFMSTKCCSDSWPNCTEFVVSDVSIPNTNNKRTHVHKVWMLVFRLPTQSMHPLPTCLRPSPGCHPGYGVIQSVTKETAEKWDHLSTDLAWASSKLWSVMVMICWRTSPISCFLWSPGSPWAACCIVSYPCWPTTLGILATGPCGCISLCGSSMLDPYGGSSLNVGWAAISPTFCFKKTKQNKEKWK